MAYSAWAKLLVLGNAACIAGVLVFARPSILAVRKPAIFQANLAELQTVKTIFVDGNSESADEIRDRLESRTCLILTNNKSRADAIMSVEERLKPNVTYNRLATSATVTLPNGDQVWSKTGIGLGFFRTGAAAAAERILDALARDACAGRSQPSNS